MKKGSSSIVIASEIGDYVYCKRGWWLRSHGLLKQNEAMLQGTAEHNKLFLVVSRHKILFILSLLLVGIGVILLVLWLSVTFLF